MKTKPNMKQSRKVFGYLREDGYKNLKVELSDGGHWIITASSKNPYAKRVLVGYFNDILNDIMDFERHSS